MVSQVVHPGPGLVDPALLHDLLVPVCKRNFLIHCPTHLNHCPHTSQYCPTHLKRCLLKLCVCVDACLLDVVRYRRASRGPLPDPLGVDVALRNLGFPQDRSSVGTRQGTRGCKRGWGHINDVCGTPNHPHHGTVEHPRCCYPVSSHKRNCRLWLL